MAVMDMIMEAMCPTPDAKFLQKAERLQKMKNKETAKALNIGGKREQSTEIPMVSMKATDALEALTAHMQVVEDLNLNQTAPELAEVLQEANALEAFLAPKAPPVDYGLEKAIEAANEALTALDLV